MTDEAARQASTTPHAAPRTILVLGGGGMKGIVHVGVLRALDKLGIHVDEIVGTSIGAVVGAMRACGLSMSEMESIVCDLDRKDFFRIKILKFLVKGYRHASLYKGEMFRKFLADNLPKREFDELVVPFYCNAVSLETGAQRYFGGRGSREISLIDAVYASATLPGIFEPLEWNGEMWIDGGIVDALPLRWARAQKPERIIAVDLSVRDYRERQEYRRSLPWILFRAFELGQEALVEHNLHQYAGPDIVHIKPPVGHRGIFDFEELVELIELGEQDATDALVSHPSTRDLCDPEIRRHVEENHRLRRGYATIHIDPDKCNRCGICTVTCGTEGYAANNGDVLHRAEHDRCTLDGACVRNCPTDAIDIRFP
ncbi:MAG: patatin-like phospholipase family protein [Planctomycetes bacterium]|nr:patatin-like phospholipase family protein [Planctomycetota bacterium]